MTNAIAKNQKSSEFDQVNKGYGKLIAQDSVRVERLLPGPVERVWSFLTDSDKRSKWLAAGPMELHVGGKVEHVFNNQQLSDASDCTPAKYTGCEGYELQGKITACEPPRLLSYLWDSGSKEVSEVRFELEPQADKVLLTVTHSRLASRNTILSVSSGWHAHLDILLAHLQEQTPPSFWSRHTQLEREYDTRL